MGDHLELLVFSHEQRREPIAERDRRRGRRRGLGGRIGWAEVLEQPGAHARGPVDHLGRGRVLSIERIAPLPEYVGQGDAVLRDVARPPPAGDVVVDRLLHVPGGGEAADDRQEHAAQLPGLGEPLADHALGGRRLVGLHGGVFHGQGEPVDPLDRAPGARRELPGDPRPGGPFDRGGPRPGGALDPGATLPLLSWRNAGTGSLPARSETAMGTERAAAAATGSAAAPGAGGKTR